MGKAIIVTLSNELKKEFPKTSGFSNIKTSLIWFSFITNIIQMQISNHWLEKLAGQKILLFYQNAKTVRNVNFISYLLKKFGWTKDVLINQVSKLMKYLLNQTNFDAVLPEKIKKQAYLAIKDHYTFDFMELADEHSEYELEQALIKNIRHSFQRQVPILPLQATNTNYK